MFKLYFVFSTDFFNGKCAFQQNCFVNDELVMWLEDTVEVAQPPLIRGAKGVSGFPIDPRTGKPLNFLPPGLNVAFGPGIGGNGGGGPKEPTDCPYHILSNGTAVKKCDNDPQACGICMLTRRKREFWVAKQTTITLF